MLINIKKLQNQQIHNPDQGLPIPRKYIQPSPPLPSHPLTPLPPPPKTKI